MRPCCVRQEQHARTQPFPSREQDLLHQRTVQLSAYMRLSWRRKIVEQIFCWGEGLVSPTTGKLVLPQPWQHLPALVWCGHSRGRTSQPSFGADTGVAGPRGGRLARTRPWQDLATVVWRGHGRGRTSQPSFGVDTAVAGPRDGWEAFPRLWQGSRTGHTGETPKKRPY